MDYQAALFDPIYTLQGVPVVLTLSDNRVFEELTALDKTAGIDVGDQGAQVQTIKPAACFRVRELAAAGIAVDQLPSAVLEMNEFVWDVTSYRLKPSPRGENDGEVYLILSGKTAVESESDS